MSPTSYQTAPPRDERAEARSRLPIGCCTRCQRARSIQRLRERLLGDRALAGTGGVEMDRDTVAAEALHATREGAELGAVGHRLGELHVDADVAALGAAEHRELLVQVLDVVGAQRTRDVKRATLGRRARGQ